MRTLLLIAAIWLGFVIIRHFARAGAGVEKKGGETPPHVENMVQCEQCQVHLPSSEAIHDGNHIFCSQAHRQAWLSRQDRS